jgi:hypothetical protein
MAGFRRQCEVDDPSVLSSQALTLGGGRETARSDVTDHGLPEDGGR